LQWLLLDLKLNLLPLLALLAGLAISLWANPWVLFASGASGHVAVRFLEVASFVVGGLLGSQILGPEVRARAVEVVGSRSARVRGLRYHGHGLVATSLVTGVFLIASVAEIQLGPWHLFPLYAYYARPAMMTAKLAWALISAGLLAYALMKAVRPAPLLQRMD